MPGERDGWLIRALIASLAGGLAWAIQSWRNRRRKMQTQRERLTNIMDGVLGKIKLGDTCKGEASGPQLVAAQDPNGAQGITVGWQLTVWLQHDKLLGQDPVGVSVPVGMMLPPQQLVERITHQLLEEARNLRFRANQDATGLQMPSAESLRGIGNNGQRPS